MTISIEETTAESFPALVLANDRIRAVVVPALGGRVWELTDRERDRQWIWHRPGVPLAAAGPEAAYDDVWAGGWEELFPNDAAGEFEGSMLTDHGEWWRTPWEVTEATRTADAAVLRLSARMTVRPATCTKEFRLPAQSDTLAVSYRIRNEASVPYHFLFKQHLPIAVAPGCRLALPGGSVTAVDPSFGTLLPGPGPFDWPSPVVPSAQIADLGTVPPAGDATREFVYVADLPQGWCRVEDPAKGAQLHFTWDSGSLPFLWLFLAYGGWRDCYTAVIEPCTNMPKDLTLAAQAGRSAYLRPNEAFETKVSIRLSTLESNAK